MIDNFLHFLQCFFYAIWIQQGFVLVRYCLRRWLTSPIIERRDLFIINQRLAQFQVQFDDQQRTLTQAYNSCLEKDLCITALTKERDTLKSELSYIIVDLEKMSESTFQKG